MRAIFKREFGSYFNSPIGFVILAIFYLFSGIYFTYYCISGNTDSLGSVFGSCFAVTIVIIPLLTMRTLSEERKQKTDQILLTSPVSVTKIVIGKFLGAFSIFALCCSIFILYGIVIMIFTMPQWNLILSTLLGMLLYGAAMIALGIFISSLTENQIIAAVITLASGLVIYLIDGFAAVIAVPFISNLLIKLSFVATFSNMALGLINLSDIIYMLSVVAIFLFLTIRVVDKRRWA